MNPYFSFKPQGLSKASVEIGVEVILCPTFADTTVLRYRARFVQRRLITDPEFSVDRMEVLPIEILEGPPRRKQCC